MWNGDERTAFYEKTLSEGYPHAMKPFQAEVCKYVISTPGQNVGQSFNLLYRLEGKTFLLARLMSTISATFLKFPFHEGYSQAYFSVRPAKAKQEYIKNLETLDLLKHVTVNTSDHMVLMSDTGDRQDTWFFAYKDSVSARNIPFRDFDFYDDAEMADDYFITDVIVPAIDNVETEMVFCSSFHWAIQRIMGHRPNEVFASMCHDKGLWYGRLCDTPHSPVVTRRRSGRETRRPL